MRHALIASAILLTACSPRVIERVRTVTVQVPIAAPCPRPDDVRPMPAKPYAELSDDARTAAAQLGRWLADLVPWGRAVEAQQRACSSVGQ